jgi:hypothetical protein
MVLRMNKSIFALPLTTLVLACTTPGSDDASSGDSSDSSDSADTSDTNDTSDTGDTGGPSECADDLWADLANRYPDAGDVGSCDGIDGAAAIVSSLMNMDGLTIDDGTGNMLAPCVEARCDADYVYIASNGLMHYDFVQTTPNALTEVNFIYRVPIVPQPNAGSGAIDVATLDGCVDAHNAFVADPNAGTNQEPSGLCTQAEPALLQFGSQVVAQIPCLDTMSAMINGVPVFGPNEAGMPDPWGSPIFFYPDDASEPYVPDDLMMGAALDLCGAHTGNSAHNHGVNEACFELAPDNKPANSYVAATEGWVFETELAGDCSEASGIVGWSMDGHPIKGPCVCIATDDQGACTDVRRARSSWVYAGLSSWSSDPGADPDNNGELSSEGSTCTTDDDCCGGDPACNFACNFAVFDDPAAPGGSTAEKRCVAFDYSWCTHRWVERDDADDDATNFVYLDPCNGYDGPDGYAYHGTLSFPYVQGCFRDVPSDSIGPTAAGGGDGGGDGDMDTGMEGGNCMPGQTSMCCGDGVCDGPETAQTCPEDC